MIFDGLVCIYIYFSGGLRGLTGKALLLEESKDSCVSVRLALKHFLFAYMYADPKTVFIAGPPFSLESLENFERSSIIFTGRFFLLFRP